MRRNNWSERLSLSIQEEEVVLICNSNWKGEMCVPRANWRGNAGFLICCKWRWALSWVGQCPQETRQRKRDLAVGVGLQGEGGVGETSAAPLSSAHHPPKCKDKKSSLHLQGIKHAHYALWIIPSAYISMLFHTHLLGADRVSIPCQTLLDYPIR